MCDCRRILYVRSISSQRMENQISVDEIHFLPHSRFVNIKRTRFLCYSYEDEQYL